MPYRILADTVLVIHMGFILFVVAGAFLVLSFSHMGEGEKNACVAAMDAAKTKFDKAK